MDELAIIRRHYAEGLRLMAGLSSEALVDAFAAVPRERFLGPGPWRVMTRGYQSTPDADPRHLYHNVLVAIVEERVLNNGQPSFLATLMDSAKIAGGDHVVHLGAGVGYYSAVMAEAVGAEGRVTAIEADPELAARAIENLADRDNVQAMQGDALEADFEEADVIFVNFGLTHPHVPWLERLRPGGRLQVPITANTGLGMVMRFTRTDLGIEAKGVAPTQIFSSVSGRDPELEGRLLELYSAGPMGGAVVASLRLDAHGQDASCWLHGAQMCLSTRALETNEALAPYLGRFDCNPQLSLTFTEGTEGLRVSGPLGGGPLQPAGEDRFEAPGIAHFTFERSDPAAAPDRVTVKLGERTLQGTRVS